MDARILARRRAVATAPQRRQLRTLASVVLLGFLALGAWGLTRTPLFAVDGVAVIGVGEELAAQVREVAGVRPGTNLLDVDLDGVAAAVGQLGWVVDASAGRRPPSYLEVRVVARAPAAVVEAGGAAWLVAGDGTVLGAAGTPVGGVRISAPAALMPAPGARVADAAVLEALTVAADLPAALLPQVRRLDARAGGHVLIVAIPSDLGPLEVAVRLGAAEAVGDKGRVTLALVDQVRAHAEGGVAISLIDVRAPAHPVLVRAAP